MANWCACRRHFAFEQKIFAYVILNAWTWLSSEAFTKNIESNFFINFVFFFLFLKNIPINVNLQLWRKFNVPNLCRNYSRYVLMILFLMMIDHWNRLLPEIFPKKGDSLRTKTNAISLNKLIQNRRKRNAIQMCMCIIFDRIDIMMIVIACNRCRRPINDNIRNKQTIF